MTLAQQLTELRIRMIDENRQRDVLMETEEYKEKQEQINSSEHYLQGLKDELAKMLDVVHDSRDEYEEVKRKLLIEMRDKGLEKLDNVEAKMRVSKSVDRTKFCEFFGGSIDEWLSLSEVTQTKLKEYEKENSAFRGLAKKAIIETGREITDIIVILP